jgi:hypothetical protein
MLACDQTSGLRYLSTETQERPQAGVRRIPYHRSLPFYTNYVGPWSKLV